MNGDFEGREGAAGVAIAFYCPDFESIIGDVDGEVAVAAFSVGDGTLDDELDVFDCQWLEAKESAATDKGGVDAEEGVFGGGADEGDEAAFDIVEQDILLAAREAVDFIEEEDGSAAAAGEQAVGFLDDFADAGNADGRGVFAHELTFGVFCDQLGERGFPGAGRAVEDERCEGICLEHAAEEFAFAQDVLLAGVFVDGARPHAHRQGHDAAGEFFARFGEEVGHGEG